MCLLQSEKINQNVADPQKLMLIHHDNYNSVPPFWIRVYIRVNNKKQTKLFYRFYRQLIIEVIEHFSSVLFAERSVKKNGQYIYYNYSHVKNEQHELIRKTTHRLMDKSWIIIRPIMYVRMKRMNVNWSMEAIREGVTQKVSDRRATIPTTILRNEKPPLAR